MDMYLNECSFHEQFFERSKLERAFRTFFTVLDKVSDLSDLCFYWDQTAAHKAFRNELLVASLNHLLDKSLCTAILNLLYNKLITRSWREDQLHSLQDNWLCEADDVSDTCMAELAERTLRHREIAAALLNFPNSKYSARHQLNVSKNVTLVCELDCLEDKLQLADWLGYSLDPTDVQYDYTSVVPPRDHETVLRNFIRFEKTPRRQAGKRVYKEVAEQRYWYIDSLHFGYAAHLEVFDRHGSHLGEANLDGELDSAKRDPNKHFDP